MVVDEKEPDAPSLGSIVLYVMADGKTVRPAIVVDVTSPNFECNLQVFVNGQFDDATVRGAHANGTLTDWKVGVAYDTWKGAGTWHWSG